MFLLLKRRGDLGGAFLKLDRIRPGMDSRFYHSFGDIEIAIVVNANLGDNIGRVPIANKFLTEINLSSHVILQNKL